MRRQLALGHWHKRHHFVVFAPDIALRCRGQKGPKLLHGIVVHGLCKCAVAAKRGDLLWWYRVAGLLVLLQCQLLRSKRMQTAGLGMVLTSASGRMGSHYTAESPIINHVRGARTHSVRIIQILLQSLFGSAKAT